jgi:uncharacterized membrane protein
MLQYFRPLLAALSGAALLLLGGCGEDTGPTGTTCPPEGTQLTAQNFGTSFMQQYCTRCHSSKLSGLSRQGAPSDVNVDTLEGVRKSASEIDQWTGAGPNRENTAMPSNGPTPTTEERRKLSEWLACGAPQ